LLFWDRLYDNEKLWIDPWGDNSLRVRSTKNTEMPKENWALIERESQADIEIGEKKAVIINGNIRAEISLNGKLTIFNNDTIILNEYLRNMSNMEEEYASCLEIDAREFRPILGGDYELTMRFESLDPDEKIYGMGQYQQKNLDLKGTELELAHRNSQASIPFAVSNLGYGFLWNNPAIGRVTFGKNVTTWNARSTKVLDYWVTAGDTPEEILEAYASVTGTVPMMPDFAMGFWQSKLRYQTQEELLEVAREHKRKGLPLSVIVVDFFHWPMQGDFKFDLDYWPNPDAMVQELNEMGIELVVSVWPTVDMRSINYEEMMQKGYLIRADRGPRIGILDYRGATIFFDATNPGARDFVWQKAKANYYKKGIKCFWLDESEPEYMVYDFDNYLYHLGSNLQIGNIYPKHYAKAFYDGMKEEGQANIINLIRCAWAGSQKYGALLWSGDIKSTFSDFRKQLAAGLNSGLSGIPWWTTDIGGFYGGNPDDPQFRNLFTRWFQWGTFCPVMRNHGFREPAKKPIGTSGAGVARSGGNNEVWSFGDDIFKICKKYLSIRENIKPYIKEQMMAAHEKGTPVMRPLFYDFPKDKKTWEYEEMYMFGPDLLVAPVMIEKVDSMDIYLPAGTEWEDVWTGSKYEGG
jgi:alpha-D-xyloside xylohydrolase